MSANNGASAGSDTASADASVVEAPSIALSTGRPFDQQRAEAAGRELLIAVGEDPDRPGLLETPARGARAYRETFAGLYT